MKWKTNYDKVLPESNKIKIPKITAFWGFWSWHEEAGASDAMYIGLSIKNQQILEEMEAFRREMESFED